MDDWVPGKHDRRDPPEETVKDIMRRVESRLVSATEQSHRLEVGLASAEAQRKALGDGIRVLDGNVIMLTGRLDRFDVKMQPVLDWHQKVQGAQFAASAAAKTATFVIFIIGVLAGLIAFLKAFVWPVRP